MKNFKKTFQATFILIMVICFTAHAQTNVSGGIFSNTTWTLANSPYIVTDTVVVFPNVTLTIEPGVTIKFENDKMLEIRQAQLIAIGTPVDSITFTSNSPSPVTSIWNSVFINGANYVSTFSYCNFYYATTGINVCSTGTIVNNSNFDNNHTGISHSCGNIFKIDSCNFLNNNYGISAGYNSFIKTCIFRLNNVGMNAGSNSEVLNCTVNSNQTGIFCGGHNTIKDCIIDSNAVAGISLQVFYYDSIVGCELKYNGIGIKTPAAGTPGIVITKNIIENNTTGILLGYPAAIYCNKICSNTSYDLKILTSNNVIAAYNDWCTPDSASTTAKIYDAYDNISLGIVTFMPLDTAQCYLTATNCYALFNLYADTIPHNWIAVNQSTGLPPLSYSWDWDDGSPNDTGATPSHIYSTAGYYNVCLTVTNSLAGCNSTYCIHQNLSRSSSAASIVTINVILTTGINPSAAPSNSFSMYPNPAQSMFIIKSSSGLINARAEIFNTLGEKVYTTTLISDQQTINEKFPAGIYFVKVATRANQFIRKLVVQ